jgi:hypothetical protein
MYGPDKIPANKNATNAPTRAMRKKNNKQNTIAKNDKTSIDIIRVHLSSG